MAGFFSKIFGGKKKSNDGDEISQKIDSVLTELSEKAGFEFNFEISALAVEDETKYLVQLEGPDEDLLKDRDGQLMDELQLFLQRVVQHNFPEARVNVAVDCAGFREETEQALIDLAEKLKISALEKNKPVYIRALPPRDRKVVHQYLSGDPRVKSRSIGDGIFKRIRVYPARDPDAQPDSYQDDNG